MQPVNPDGQYFCEQCTARYDAPGDCSACPEEPLLNLLDENVLLLLASFDQRRFNERVALTSGVAAVLLAPVGLGLFLLAREIGLFAYGLAVSALAGGLFWLFPPERKTPDLGQNH